VTALADAAIAWYEVNARELPWRQPGVSPWAVLVSEVMLAQTPVARVEPVWHAFVARWPTPAALAEDTPAEAIRTWGRLGYPRRALRLHACAVQIMQKYGGDMPDGVAALESLPGIGAYTARAVAAFAFGQRQPVVDTNVRRLVGRAVHGTPDGTATTTSADLAAVMALLPAEPARAAQASVALMELGALVCVARSPACGRCPLATGCAWFAAGAPEGGPSRRPPQYAGTDRQVRGLLLAVLRDATGPVSPARLDPVWADPVQRDRALASLLEDGLVVPVANGRYALAGEGGAPS
jgi:A/G-specific adenine glycosylase